MYIICVYAYISLSLYIYIYIHIRMLIFAACPLLIFAAWMSGRNPHIIPRVGLTYKIVYTSRFVRVILAQGPC